MEGLAGLSQNRWRFPALIEAATPEIYRQNAFRVLGLPITADERAIREREKLLRMAKQFGIVAGPEERGYLPLSPPPDDEAIKRAVARLREPEARLVDELFWFWARDLGTSEDDELRLLRGGQSNRAFATWLEQEREGRSDRASRHNITVLYHLTALELEHKGAAGGLSQEERKTRATCWLRAYRRWRKLLTEEGFWTRVTARIDERGDPRLTAQSALRIREDLGRGALLLINARMAVRAAEEEREKRAKRQLGIMLASGFDETVVYEVVHYALSSVRQRIKTICERAESQARADPKGADDMALHLLKDSARFVRTVDLLLPIDDPLRQGLHDDVARTSLDCALAFVNETADWKGCVKILDRISEVAVGEAIRSRIEENREFVEPFLKQERQQARFSSEMGTDRCYTVALRGRDAVVPQACACCLGPAETAQPVSYSWEETRGLQRYQGSIGFAFPLCRACQSHQKELGKQRVLLVLLAGGLSLGLSALVGLSTDGLAFVPFVLVGCLSSAILLALLSGVIRVRPLGDKHADRGPVVAIETASEAQTTFRFLSPFYADAFADANEVSMHAGRAPKYSRGGYLLSGRSALQVVAWLSIAALIGHSVIYAVTTEEASSSPGHARPSRPTSPSRRRSGAGGRRTTGPTSGRSLLASQIEQGRTRVRRMEEELADMVAKLSAMRSRLDSLKDDIKRHERRGDLDLRVDMAAYRKALSNHNELVTQHNHLLAKHGLEYTSYKAELEQLNGMIQRHNIGAR